MKKLKDNSAFKQWHKTIRKFYYAPFVTNPDLIDEVLKYIDSLQHIVDKVNSKTAWFRDYMKWQFLRNEFAGPECFNHFESFLKGYVDTTNNVNESLNHSLNSSIPYRRQNLGSIAKIIYNKKFAAIECLVEITADPYTMNNRTPEQNAHRILISSHIGRFAEMSSETQKKNLVRYL